MESIRKDFQAISSRFYAVVDQVMQADATAMLRLWSEQDDITYCDPYAHIHFRVRKQDHIDRLHALATNIYRYEGQQWRMIHRHAGTPCVEE